MKQFNKKIRNLTLVLVLLMPIYKNHELFSKTHQNILLVSEKINSREDALKEQITRLEKLLLKSEKWLHFSSDLFREALNTSLKTISKGIPNPPQIQIKHSSLDLKDIEKAEWIFPEANDLPGGDQSWGDVLDHLRPLRKPGQKIWEWRRDTSVQPVVFKDPDELDSGRVHLHLEHPLVKRLLSRFLVRGFQKNNISKAAVLGTKDDTAKLILLARLSLYGHGASRLHDEMIELVAEWDPLDPNRRLRILNPTRTEFAIEDLAKSLRENLSEIDPKIQNQLKKNLVNDVRNLGDRLSKLADERSSRAVKMLNKRADEESKKFMQVLNEQRSRIIKTQRNHDTGYEQLTLGFANQELIQLRSNLNYWGKRLENIEKDLRIEPKKIKRTFEVATSPRVEPAGVIILWPAELVELN